MNKACKCLLFFDLRLMYVRKRVWTASGPRFGAHLGIPNRSKIDLEAIWKGIKFQTSIRGPQLDAMEDRFQIDLGPILAAQMGAKSRPEGGEDRLSDLYQ